MDAQKTAYYLAPDQLKVGVFVMLELPWFKHPFTLSNFKISSESLLQEVRELGLKRYRYDPDRSDSTTAQTAAEAEAPPPVVEADATVDDPALAGKRQRMAAMERRRERVGQVEKAFVKATAVVRNLNRNLLARPKETLEEMGGLVGQMVDAFLESPDATLLVMGEKAGGEEVYFHSLNVTVLTMMLARDLGFTPAQARELGIGAMVHDLGLSEIPDKVLKKPPEEQTSSERQLRTMHVEYGLSLAKRLGLPGEAMAVIAQHHELADGSGYPRNLKSEAMTPAARLVSMVNFYDNLCNPVNLATAMTPHEALSFMFAQRRGKFEARALQLMIRSLGVYPPGTLVQLSNEALALVTSINPKKPLRPWVTIYDPQVPKESAIMLDLEQEPEINISKAIRPALLPPKVAAYLSPRKRVTYYFDGGDGERGGGG